MDKWDKRFINIAKEVSTWSKDPSTKVGAVIVSPDKDIVATGYNGFPRGIHDNENDYENRELKYKKVVHAEMNAIIRSKRDLTGHTLYVYPIQCCSNCAACIIQSGIKRIVSLDTNHALKDSFILANEMFNEAGIEVILYKVSEYNKVIPNYDEGGYCC